MAINTKSGENILNHEILEKQYGSDNKKYQDHILEQYKLYVEMADRISTRRSTANSFFLTINTAIVALVSYVCANSPKNESTRFHWLIGLAGIALCYMWYSLIQSYKNLNTGKFKVIHLMEKQLPMCPYDTEWYMIGRGQNADLYLPFTHIEIGVPWVFLCIHAFVVLACVPWSWFIKLCVNN